MEKHYFRFLENIHDWNISRQIVWGIRIPAFKCKDCGQWEVTEGELREKCGKCSGKMEQDPDVFDTWFSSGQWPFTTLMSSSSSSFKVESSKLENSDYKEFYPTTVMETGYDILRWWVARMVMLGLYETKERPFENIVLHGLVNDPLGKKMSKSKGNVINPIELVDEYGADAMRFALVYGTALGNDQSLSYPKLQAMRNFTNKLWNMARFIEMNRSQKSKVKSQKSLEELGESAENGNDKEMVKKIQELTGEVTRLLDNNDFNHAAQNLYEFIWHEFADVYIEDVKNRIDEHSFSVLSSSFNTLLKLLHPFMPFVTQEINKRLFEGEDDLIISKWPIKNA